MYSEKEVERMKASTLSTMMVYLDFCVSQKQFN